MTRDELFAELVCTEEDHAALAELATLLEPLPVSASARARLLAAVAAPALRWAPLFEKLARFFDLPRAALTALSERAAKDEEWESAPLDGVRLLHLSGGPALGGADAGLVWLKPGLHFPEHRHLGEERTLILEGSVRYDSGQIQGPGDTLRMPAGSRHSFAVTSEQPLIYALILHDAVEIAGQRFPPITG